MRAIVLDAYGNNTELHLREMADPIPAPGQVRLRVRAVGIAIWDAMVREGKFPMPSKLPLTPGFEGAGVVDAVGAGVERWKPGDEVWTMSYQSSGLWAELATVGADECAPKPSSFGFDESCGLGVAAVTAYMAIVETLAPVAGEIVLVAGAAGGVGTIAVQLAEHLGARVIATGGPGNADYIRSLGAHDYIDYTRGDVAAQVRALAPQGVDAALDAVNGTNARETVKAVCRGGRIAIVTPPELEPEDRSIRVTRIESAPTPERLAAVTQFAQEGALRTKIDRRFTLETIPEGLAYVELGHTSGKVVAEI